MCVEKVNEEVEDLSCSRTINIFVRHDALFFSDIARILMYLEVVWRSPHLESFMHLQEVLEPG